MSDKVNSRHIDALIAEHVFGEKPIVRIAASKDGGKSFAVIESTAGPFYNENQIRDWIEEHPGYELMGVEYFKNYSTSIADAWTIVDKINDMCLFLTVENWPGKLGYEKRYAVSINKYIPYEGYEHLSRDFSDSLPMAICLAALKALNISYESK